MKARDRIAQRRADVELRRDKVYMLWIEGKSQADIARSLELSEATISIDLKHAKALQAQESKLSARSYRALNAQRLEELYAAVEVKAHAGDPVAIANAIKIIDKLNAMYGLYGEHAAQPTATTNNYFLAFPGQEAIAPSDPNDQEGDYVQGQRITPLLTDYARADEDTDNTVKASIDTDV